MKLIGQFGLVAALALAALSANAQSVGGGDSGGGVLIGEPVTPYSIDVDLRDLPTALEWQPGDPIREAQRRVYRPLDASNPHAPAELITAPDLLAERQAWYDANNRPPNVINNPPRVSINNPFTGVSPADPVVEVNANFIVYGVNSGGSGTYFNVYDKSGTLVSGPTTFGSLAPAGNSCTSDRGDPIIHWDRLANRWFLLVLDDSALCVYVSKTENPVTGGWWFYRFATPSLPDYPHCSVWHNAYVCTTNEGSPGAAVYAFDRANMLNGATARPTQRLSSVPNLAGYGFQALTPATFMGSSANAPPAGMPAILARHNDDEAHAGAAANGSADFIELYLLNLDWNTPANSIIVTSPRIQITEFNSWFRNYSTFATVPQPGSTSRLDPIREVILNSLVYRNLGNGVESIVGNIATNQDPARTGTVVDAGIRWFELRRSGGTGDFTLHQEGTFSPGDSSTHHLIGAVATDKLGNIFMSYNVTRTTSPTVFASLRYTGRLATDSLGVMSLGETEIATGAAVETSGRWGDYHQTVVDPADDCTFWTVGMYRPTGSWQTRIQDFKFPGCVASPAAGLTVTESGGSSAVSEGGATDSYEVVLNSAPSANVSVNLAFNAAQLTVNGDTDGSTSLLFTTANWSTPQTVNVVATNDMVVEAPLANSVIAQTITSADPAYAAIDPADISVAVTDNDIAVVGFAANDDVFAEAGGNFQKAVVLTITASGVGPSSLQNALSIPLTFTEGSALEPEDFTLTTAQVTFPAGATSGAQQNAVTAIVNDAIDEDAESFAITLVTAGAPTNINFNRSVTSVQIADDDTAGVTLVQSGGTTAVTEGGATDSYSVVLNSQPSANVGITIVFDPAQLILNGDTDGTLSLQFTPATWDVVQTVTVSAVDDTLVEANPHSTSIVQTVSSSDPVYAVINPADVTVSIAENDIQQITFALASSSVSETAGTHTVNVRLSVLSNGTPGGTISADMTANVILVLGSAETADLGLVTTSVTFPAGSAHNSTLPIDLSLVNDRLLEGNETATLSLALVTSTGSVSGTHVVTVTDDEVGSISFTTPSSATSESAGTHSGAIGRLTISGSGTGPLASEANVSVAITDTSGTATTLADYTVSTSTLVFPANAPSPVELPIAVSIANDALIENAESFSLGFGAISGAGALSASGAHGVSIGDNDLAQVGFAPGNDSVGEGAGSFGKPVVLTLTADGAGTPSLQGTLVVPIGFAEGTALEPEDFALATASVSFAAGSLNGASQNASASLVDDAVSEAVETFELTLGNGFVTPNITLGRAATTVSIVDNDIPGITVVQSGGSTAVAEGGATDNFTVVLTSQPTSNVTVALAGSQATPNPTPLTFTPGNWNVAQTVTVTAIDDAIDEASPHAGSVSFAVSSGDANYNGLAVSAVSVQVDDNDSAGVSVSEAGGNTAVTEGGATDSYTVVLTSQPTENVAVVLGVGAQASLSPSGLTFTAANWNVAQTVTVTATDDAVVEGAHTAAITHSTSSSDPNYSGIAVTGITVDISDNDSAVVGFAAATLSQSEGSSPMVFSVTLSAPVASGVTLTVNSANATATAGADYTAITGQMLSFAPGSTSAQTVNVVIADDVLDENDETFSVTLSDLAATGDVTLGTATSTGTIVDDDLPPVISITSPSQPEGDAGNTPMDFVVSLSAISGRDISFTRATADGTAAVGNNDYQPLAAALITIPAGQSGTTLSVPIVGDTVFEGDESFNLNLTNIVNATTGGPVAEGTLPGLSAIGTIEDDDQQPTTTTISSDDPDASVVGQAYTVVVNVAAQTLSPLGTVTISDGSASCGPVALTTGTAPNSSASCALTSTTAGAKTLTATYTPASTAFAASSDTEAHQVNAASTMISVVGPTRSRINQPTTFSFALNVNAPGAGSPAGTVTLSSGAATCNVSVPTATPSCALSFDTLGPRTISAAFVPADGNFLASSSSGAGNAQTLVFALSDIAVTKSDGLGTFRPGDLVVYTVTVRNLGADAAAQIRVIDNVPAGLVDVVWTCDASGGVACPAAGGSGNLDLTVASFPVGGLLNFTFYGNVDGSPGQLVNTALVQLPADTTIEDPVPGNNSATDTNLLELLFANGFEAAAVNAPNGSFRLPSASLRGSLDEVAIVVYGLVDANGEALRVYARVIDSEVQYALATRDAQGRLRLGAWASYAGDPLLTWTARPVADGWVLDSAGLR